MLDKQGVAQATRPRARAPKRARAPSLARVEAEVCDPQTDRETWIAEGRFGSIVGASEPMLRLYDLLSRVAPSHASVLISGESGTGKELVARTIHDLSARRNAPFVAVNCGAISAGLVESVVFGHEKGSFSGAMSRHRGLFEQAAGGTLLLDEVTEMDGELQVKLLRVLETGQLARVGGERPVDVDVRVLATTNRVPSEAVDEGRLRADLHYRLRMLHVEVPTLRARPDDLDLLAQALLSEITEREGVPKAIDAGIVPILQAYDWPGNVRELRNALYSAYLLSQDGRIEAKALPTEVRDGGQFRIGAWSPYGSSMARPLDDAEERLILMTIAYLDGRREWASDILRVELEKLYARLQSCRQAT
jgi:DNA-binding NtrC family response regulator